MQQPADDEPEPEGGRAANVFANFSLSDFLRERQPRAARGAYAPGRSPGAPRRQQTSARPGKCPPGLRPGDPISPPPGYTSDAFVRLTAVVIDSAGNVWVADNWKPNPPKGRAIPAVMGWSLSSGSRGR